MAVDRTLLGEYEEEESMTGIEGEVVQRWGRKDLVALQHGLLFGVVEGGTIFSYASVIGIPLVRHAPIGVKAY